VLGAFRADCYTFARVGVTFADLRYRYRQFLIAVVGAGLVLAMALLMSGLVGGFTAETDWTVGGVGAQRWVLAENSRGSIAGSEVFPQSDAALIARSPGVTRAAPLAIVHQVARIGRQTRTVQVFGVQIGNIGDPTVTAGHALSGSGQVVADAGAGATVGQAITVGDMPFRVVGQVNNRTMLAGIPILYVSLHDAQALAFAGRALVTAVVTRGVPATVPAGLAVLSNQAVEQGVLANLSGAVSSINNSKIIMWLVAALIVAALLYVSALQRVRDFAVIKALGSSSLALFGSLALQAVVVTLLAAVFAIVVCNFMGGLFKQPVAIPASAFATLPAIAVAVGLIASLVAMRRVTRADPAAAFSG
jgi:putative ABC transport system permease protein